ncbi:MAG: hypothetical protein E2P02_07885 [Acidobacteria bacterium]|nr:MAG: hypothetical protein E2P02_07885 [Acidobacteriota bacterium]
MLTGANGLVVEPARTATFSIGGVILGLECLPGGDPLVLPAAYRSFQRDGAWPDIQVRIGKADSLEDSEGAVIYRAADHWRALAERSGVSFEIFYPPTSRLYCRMAGRPPFSRFELLFGSDNLNSLPEEFTRQCAGRLWIPHPFEQLAFVPTLARRGGFLVHACAAVVGGKGLVFAGHSGDGKTTLSHALRAEGLELLSDERVAIKRQEDGFVVHGTPWTGEGEIVSNVSVPLGGIFVLQQAREHRVRLEASSQIVAELLSRSIVPYYLDDTASRIVTLVHDVAAAVPLGALECSLEPGLRDILERFLETPRVFSTVPA